MSKVDPLGLVGTDGSGSGGQANQSCGCSQSSNSYLQNVANNFNANNDFINSIPSEGALRFGIGIASAGFTARAIGSITLLQAAGYLGTGNFGGAALFAGITTVVNTAAVTGAFQFGNLAGSMINAIPTGQCGGTLRDSISNLLQ